MQPPVAIVFVILGCCSNVVFLECMTKVQPGCGNLVTCAQFLFIATYGFVKTMKCGREPIKIPIREYLIMVGLFFASSVLNNYALNFGIPMPLHMIFKSGSLVANLLMGMVVMNRFFPHHKYVAVVCITVGIIISTLASQAVKSRPTAAAAGDQPTAAAADADGLDRSSPLTLSIGVVILVAALLLSARLGIFQEMLFSKHGKHSQEAVFMTHALPLPGFLLLSSNIWHVMTLFSASEPAHVGAIMLPVPKLWAYLGINVVMQYVCISSVFSLTEQCTSLTVTLVVTLRKFISLLFSIWYFQNPFVFEHWIGCVLVFSGTLLFIDPCGMFAKKNNQTEKV